MFDSKYVMTNLFGSALRDYPPLQEIDPKGWAMWRMDGIGGSEVATLLGTEGAFSTKADIYLSKTEGKEREFSADTLEMFDLGHRVETLLLDYLDVSTLRRSLSFVDPVFPYFRINIDGEMIDEKFFTTIVECKNISVQNAHQWKVSPPQKYIDQIMYYMGFRGAEKGILIALIGGNKVKQFEVKFDLEHFKRIVNVVHDFWHDHVIPRIPPVTETREDASKFFEVTTETEGTPAEVSEVLVTKGIGLYAEMAKKKAQIGEVEAQILTECQGYSKGIFDSKTVWSGRSGSKTRSCDYDLLKKLDASVYNSVVSEKQNKDSIVFNWGKLS